MKTNQKNFALTSKLMSPLERKFSPRKVKKTKAARILLHWALDVTCAALGNHQQGEAGGGVGWGWGCVCQSFCLNCQPLCPSQSSHSQNSQLYVFLD